MKQFPREFYIPKHATRVADKLSSAVAYLYTEHYAKGGPRVGAMGFHGKAGKPDWHYTFKSIDERTAYVTRHFENVRANEERARARCRERNEYVHTLNVGDILKSSWGYDQTNVDFYQVIAKTAKTVTVRELKHSRFPGTTLLHGMADYVMPIPDDFLNEKTFTCRVSTGNSLKVDGHYASSWSGAPAYHSWYH